MPDLFHNWLHVKELLDVKPKKYKLNSAVFHKNILDNMQVKLTLSDLIA